MKDKIAEIIGQARVNSILGLSAGTSEDVKPNDYYADQILALFKDEELKWYNAGWDDAMKEMAKK